MGATLPRRLIVLTFLVTSSYSFLMQEMQQQPLSSHGRGRHTKRADPDTTEFDRWTSMNDEMRDMKSDASRPTEENESKSEYGSLKDAYFASTNSLKISYSDKIMAPSEWSGESRQWHKYCFDLLPTSGSVHNWRSVSSPVQQADLPVRKIDDVLGHKYSARNGHRNQIIHDDKDVSGINGLLRTFQNPSYQDVTQKDLLRYLSSTVKYNRLLNLQFLKDIWQMVTMWVWPRGLVKTSICSHLWNSYDSKVEAPRFTEDATLFDDADYMQGERTLINDELADWLAYGETVFPMCRYLTRVISSDTLSPLINRLCHLPITDRLSRKHAPRIVPQNVTLPAYKRLYKLKDVLGKVLERVSFAEPRIKDVTSDVSGEISDAREGDSTRFSVRNGGNIFLEQSSGLDSYSYTGLNTMFDSGLKRQTNTNTDADDTSQNLEQLNAGTRVSLRSASKTALSTENQAHDANDDNTLSWHADGEDQESDRAWPDEDQEPDESWSAQFGKRQDDRLTKNVFNNDRKETRHRVFFTQMWNFPYSNIASLSTGCTGTLVTPSHVLTAAHCVHDGVDFLSKVEMLKVMITTDVGFRVYYIHKITVPSGWLRKAKSRKGNSLQSAAFDYAVVRLAMNVTGKNNFLPLAVPQTDVMKLDIHFLAFQMHDFGLWLSVCNAYPHRTHLQGNLILTRCNASMGNSGAAVFTNDPKEGMRVVGVLSSTMRSTFERYSVITALTWSKLSDICQELGAAAQKYNVCPPTRYLQRKHMHSHDTTIHFYGKRGQGYL